jgi:tetratricopeptide (TPR) repeat protein
MGTAFYYLHQTQHSIMSLDKAMEIARRLNVQYPDYFSALFSDRGKINFDEKNFHAAYKDFRKCLKLTPGFADIDYFLALVSLKLGKFTIAKNAFAKTLKANPVESQRESILQALENRLLEENEYNSNLNRFMNEFINNIKEEKLLPRHTIPTRK